MKLQQIKNKSSYLIAVTGVFGSGKSTVGKAVSKHSLSVIDTDDIVREILSKENEVINEIVSEFGKDVLSVNTAQYINKKNLAEIIFSDESKRKKLESILHPRVRAILNDEFILNKDKSAIIFALVPLLAEANFEDMFDEIWCVICDHSPRTERLLKKGFSLSEINARTSSQLPQDEKARRADFVIDNSGSVSETESQVNERLKQLAQLNHSLHLSFDK